jgi:hypothetical protein
MTNAHPMSHLTLSGRKAATLALLAAFGLAACGDAESREDLEGQPLSEDRAEEVRPGDAWNGSPDPGVAMIPAGTSLIFEVAETVSTADHDEGDTFTLRLVSDVTGTNGAYLSEGTEAHGVVALAHESTGPEDEAALVVSVESVDVDGTPVELDAVVESATTDTATRDSGARTAAKVATGAAAGAVIGQILGGDTRSTIQGAIAGGVAGAGVAITTRDGHAVLPEGSRVVVRLEEPLPLNH